MLHLLLNYSRKIVAGRKTVSLKLVVVVAMAEKGFRINKGGLLFLSHFYHIRSEVVLLGQLGQ